MDNLVGKVAIVTGSTSGIGLASATALAEHGCRVVMHGLEPGLEHPVVDELLARGLEVAYVGGDLRKPQSVTEALASTAVALWGRIDVLVNNAAAILHKPIGRVTEDDWSTVLAVNVQAPFFLTMACAEQLALTRGSVIMISSTNALQVSRSNLVYDSSKAALNHLAQALALELRDSGVRVNTLMPGGTDTPSVLRWAEDYTGDAESARRMIADDASSGRLAQPAQIAEGVVMLAGGAATWINGATIAIDGGIRLGP